MIDKNRLEYLLQSFKKGVLTEQEDKELSAWFNESIPDDLVYPDDELSVKYRIYVRLMKDIDYPSLLKPSKYRVQLLAVAVISLFLCIGLYLFVLNEPLKTGENRVLVGNEVDIKPGGNLAQLILEDGSVITLDSDQEEIKMGEGIVYADGTELNDQNLATKKVSPIARRLILKTPKGGQYRVALSDGTTVWLNANSTLTYPQMFDGDSREVLLEGEAYFEVFRNASKPFIVKTDKQTIQVLGTSFNVNNYPNSSTVTTTLLNGSVKITANNDDKFLKSDQQLVLSSTSLKIVDVNAKDAIAWKNGKFLFNDERLDQVMTKLSRWYDIDIVFNDEKLKAERIFAAVSRYENISVVLSKIEATGVARFSLDTKKVNVFPANNK